MCMYEYKSNYVGSIWSSVLQPYSQDDSGEK